MNACLRNRLTVAFIEALQCASDAYQLNDNHHNTSGSLQGTVQTLFYPHSTQNSFTHIEIQSYCCLTWLLINTLLCWNVFTCQTVSVPVPGTLLTDVATVHSLQATENNKHKQAVTDDDTASHIYHLLVSSTTVYN